MASRVTLSVTVPPESPGAGDRRHDILNAALGCFEEGGLEAIAIDQVRQRCGASVGSIYHHFGSKEGIIAALFFDILAEQSGQLQQGLDQARDVQHGVKALVLRYVDWVVAHPQRARFLFQARPVVAEGPRGAELAEQARRRNAALLAWLTPLQRAGVLADAPCELMPSLVMGPAQSYCLAWLAGSTDASASLPSPAHFRDALATAAWKSVAAGAP